MLIEEVSDHITTRRKQNPGMEPIKLDGMNLLEETNWLSEGLRYDYLWFKYLHEVVGIYLTTDEQEEVSFFCPPELRGPVWDRYEKAFIDWRDTVLFPGSNGTLFAEGSVDAKWFDTTKGILLITPMMGAKGYSIAIDALERGHGSKREVGYKQGVTVLQVLDWLADQLEVMDEYVRKGWFPMIMLPTVFTSQGPRVAYKPEAPGVYALLNPLEERW